MKLGELKSIGHNIADSLASGIGILIGVATTDIFFEASSSADGYIVVDFLSGTTTSGEASPDLKRVISQYREALPGLCKKHRCELGEISVLTARYGVDAVYGPHFTVTVQALDGRQSTDRYLGVPGKRLRTRPA
jgi:hypothetical protein